MQDKKEQILSIVRTLLTAAGSFFAGRMIFGTAYSDELWLGITGAIVGLGAMVWSIVDKTATAEMVESGLRQSVVIFGGLLVSSGRIKDDTVKFISLMVTTLTPLILARVSTVKSKAIAIGTLGVADLKGVDEKKPQLINPVINTPPPEVQKEKKDAVKQAEKSPE